MMTQDEEAAIFSEHVVAEAVRLTQLHSGKDAVVGLQKLKVEVEGAELDGPTFASLRFTLSSCLINVAHAFSDLDGSTMGAHWA
jgi:hypothetical protein